jgi:Fe/S biogenesis protein NfuA
MAAVTLAQGVRRIIMESVPEVRDIVDVTNHEAGANPYY